MKNLKELFREAFLPMFLIMDMVLYLLTSIFHLIRGTYLYLYLQLYIYRLGSSTKYMIKEALKHRADLSK